MLRERKGGLLFCQKINAEFYLLTAAHGDAVNPKFAAFPSPWSSDEVSVVLFEQCGG